MSKSGRTKSEEDLSSLEKNLSEAEINKIKQSRRGFISNLTKLINRVSNLIDRKENVNIVREHCEKIKETIRKIALITEKYCSLRSEEQEVEKAKELFKEQNARAIHIIEQCDEFCSYTERFQTKTKNVMDNTNDDNALFKSILVSKSKDIEHLISNSKKSSKNSSVSKSKSSKSRSSSSKSGRSKGTYSSSGKSSCSSLKKAQAESAQANLLAEQTEAKVKRKLEIIKKRQELEIAEALEEIEEAKEKAMRADLVKQIEEDSFKNKLLPLEIGEKEEPHIKSTLPTRQSSSYFIPRNNESGDHSVKLEKVKEESQHEISSNRSDTILQQNLIAKNKKEQTFDLKLKIPPPIPYPNNSLLLQGNESKDLSTYNLTSNLLNTRKLSTPYPKIRAITDKKENVDSDSSSAFLQNNKNINKVQNLKITENGTSNSKVEDQNQFNDSSTLQELVMNIKKTKPNIDQFIEELKEGEETILPPEEENLSAVQVLRWNFESSSLPSVNLIRFDGDPCKWPEFIECFKIRVHNKKSFDDNLRMERLLSVLDGDAKKAVQSLGQSGYFYASALKTLKRNFGDPVVISFLKLKSILDLPQLSSDNKIGLRNFHQQLKATIVWLKSIGYTSELCSTENLAKGITRLPNYMRSAFYREFKEQIANHYKLNLINLEQWLQNKLKELFNPIATIIYNQDKSRREKGSDNNRKGNVNVQHQSSKEEHSKGTLTCWLCEGDHKITKCPLLLSKTVAERHKLIKEKQLCFNCLSNSHKIWDCQSKYSCRADGCSKRHHTLLHAQPKQSQPPLTPSEAEGTVNSHIKNEANVNKTQSTETVTLIQIVPVILRNGNKTVYTNALLDSGSDTTLLRRDTAQGLDLIGTKMQLNISNALSVNNEIDATVVNFKLLSTVNDNKFYINEAYVVNKLQIPSQNIDIKHFKNKYQHLRDIDFPILHYSEVTLLIGTNYPHFFLQHESKAGKWDEPIAVRTSLGWTLLGEDNSYKKRQHHCYQLHKQAILSLNANVEKFWQVESYGTLPKTDPSLLSLEEKRALEILKKSTTIEDGHFKVGMLWRDDQPSLPYNRELALSRLRSLENKFSKNTSFANMYITQIKEYLNLGYARKLTNSEKLKLSDITNYIPHHGVIHPHKPGKVRVVFDAAAKYKGTSLNANLLPGIDFLNKLTSVLTRFRKGKIAVVADIEKMYHQIKVNNNDIDALRFLWREDIYQDIEDYVLLVHTFGKTDSSCIATYSLRS